MRSAYAGTASIAAIHAVISQRNEALLHEVVHDRIRGTAYALPLWQLMLHQVNHATQHRRDVAAILTAYGHSPGSLDLVIYLQHPSVSYVDLPGRRQMRMNALTAVNATLDDPIMAAVPRTPDRWLSVALTPVIAMTQRCATVMTIALSRDGSSNDLLPAPRITKGRIVAV